MDSPSSMAKRRQKPGSYGVVTRRGRKLAEELLEFGKRLSGTFDEASELKERIGDLRREIIPALAEVLLREDEQERFIAAWFILLFHAEARGLVPMRVARDAEITVSSTLAIAGDDLKTKFCLMLGQGAVVPKRALSELVKLLHHPSEAVRYFAAGAAVHVEPIDSEAVQELGRSLRGENPVWAVMAALTLLQNKLRRTEAIETISTRLGSLPCEVQYHVVNMIKPLGRQAAALRPVLAGLVRDEGSHPLLRSSAAATLGLICEGMPDAVGDLQMAIELDEWEIIVGAAEGLAAAPTVPEAAVQRLAKLLSHHELNMRRAAAHGLHHLGRRAEAAVPALVDRFADETEAIVCEDIAYALSEMGEAAVEPLLQVVRDGDLRRLPLAAAALVAMGTEAVPGIVQLLQEPNGDARKSALLMLREMRMVNDAATPLLAQIVEEATDEEEVGYALAAIREIGARAMEAAPAVIQCLLNADGGIVGLCEAALWGMGPDVRAVLEGVVREEKGARKRRLERVLDGLGGVDGRSFTELETLNKDKLLKMFAEVGRILMAAGPTSWSGLSELLDEQRDRGELLLLSNVRIRCNH